MTDFRIEKDSMGSVQISSLAYYGAQTQRVVHNFPISGSALPAALIRAIELVRFACAIANRGFGKLTASSKNPIDDSQADALLSACREVHEGKHLDQFPGDVSQTESGTSSNRNANELISIRAIEILGEDRFTENKSIHPNEHINREQTIRELCIQKGVLPRLQLDDALDPYRMTEPQA